MVQKINFEKIKDAATLRGELVRCMPRIEIHMLKSYKGLPNRGMDNAQKSIFFGDDERCRISSQCLKSAIRKGASTEDTWNTCNVGSIVAMEIKKEHPEAADEYLETVDKIVRWQLTPKMTAKANGKDASQKKDHLFKVCMADILTFAKYILEEFPLNNAVDDSQICYDPKDLKATAAGRLFLKMRETMTDREVSTEIAMFGRMSTSETLRSVDGAMCMNHAFSTNVMSGDIDEFSAADQWLNKGEMGAGMLGETSINFGCYYHYANLNMLTFVENLMCGVDYTNPDSIRRRLETAVEAAVDFIRLYALTAPTAKQTSMATFPLPDCMYITAGVRTAPVSFENAFANSVKAHDDEDIISLSVGRLIDAIEDDTFNLNDYQKRIWIADKKFGSPDGVTRKNLKDCLADIRSYLTATF